MELSKISIINNSNTCPCLCKMVGALKTINTIIGHPVALLRLFQEVCLTTTQLIIPTTSSKSQQLAFHGLHSKKKVAVVPRRLCCTVAQGSRLGR